jgi:hypothetical protein
MVLLRWLQALPVELTIIFLRVNISLALAMVEEGDSGVQPQEEAAMVGRMEMQEDLEVVLGRPERPTVLEQEEAEAVLMILLQVEMVEMVCHG